VPHSVLISDLHLCAARPEINRVFFEFLRGPAARCEALYILGDLFEYWTGDDDDTPFNASVIDALRQLAGRGVALFVMHGNRDFLLGARFAAACGAALLPDPALVKLYGVETLLMHGDTLCSDDVRYQKFRTEVRSDAWQKNFLSQPVATRRRIVEGLRADSTRDKELKTEAIMDVTPAAVETALRNHGYPRLIHGHTHRPALHQIVIDGRHCERWVLADWYTGGSYLQCDEQGCHVIRLPS
jgi:UDP-2,3-diacylglucosamine hydrolase